MLFDFGWSEILLIGAVALVFIGPKDLPKAMRVAGYWVRKARTLSREFQSGIDQMIREAELDEMRQELKKASEFDFEKEFSNSIDPTGSLAESLRPPELPDFSSTVPVAAAINTPSHGATTVPDTIEAVPAAAAGAPVAHMPEMTDRTPSHIATVGEPVPMVPGPESEPDVIAAPKPTPVAPPPEPEARGGVPPRS
ncbi:MAG: twin-arginine translocase subunit TatB [Alphaproteobacteria bacterium]|nr:twin-arginine translocase subunit TatB [Alphaproteobacteria bacterium]